MHTHIGPCLHNLEAGSCIREVQQINCCNTVTDSHVPDTMLLKQRG